MPVVKEENGESERTKSAHKLQSLKREEEDKSCMLSVRVDGEKEREFMRDWKRQRIQLVTWEKRKRKEHVGYKRFGCQLQYAGGAAVTAEPVAHSLSTRVT